MTDVLIRLAIQGAVAGLKALMKNGLGDVIEDMVLTLFDTDMPGKEKKREVLSHLGDLGGVVGDTFAGTAPKLVNGLIEMLVINHGLESGELKAESSDTQPNPVLGDG